jgi:predicted component of type VI protein secretion system
MNDHDFHRRESSRKTAGLWPQLLIGAIGIGTVLAGLPAQASESQTLWECSSYTGDAHTRCLETFAESQRDQIATLQGKLQAQQEAVNHLKDQLDRQASTSADVQRQLAQPPAVVQAVPPLYAYPPVGLGLYLGRPWIYGPPYYYRPYVYGPRYYGPRHRGHRW